MLYLSERHLRDEMRVGYPCPPEWATVLVAERFGTLPEIVEQQPADRALFYRSLLGIEGHVLGLTRGMDENDPFILSEADFEDDG